jgi:hypothetical protein
MREEIPFGNDKVLILTVNETTGLVSKAELYSPLNLITLSTQHYPYNVTREKAIEDARFAGGF